MITSKMTTRDVNGACETAKDQWQTCDWHTEFGPLKLNLNGLRSVHLERLGHATSGQESRAWRMAATWVREIEAAAAKAQELAMQARETTCRDAWISRGLIILIAVAGGKICWFLARMLRCGNASSKPLEWSVHMLVLSRKKNEGLLIGHDIDVVILEVRHGVVRIGINAPREVTVVRTEIRNDQSAVDPPQINPDPAKAPSRPQQIPLADALSDRLLHSFCERRRSWRTPDTLPTISHAETEAINGTRFG